MNDKERIKELKEQILEAQKYMTDAHAGEVRKITPLEALREQAEYYENMMDELEEEISKLKKGTRKIKKVYYISWRFWNQCKPSHKWSKVHIRKKDNPGTTVCGIDIPKDSFDYNYADIGDHCSKCFDE